MKILNSLKKKFLKTTLYNFSSKAPKEINLNLKDKKDLEKNIIYNPLSYSTNIYNKQEFFTEDLIKRENPINFKDTILHLIYFTNCLDKSGKERSIDLNFKSLNEIIDLYLKNFNFENFKENVFLLNILGYVVVKINNKKENYHKKKFKRMLNGILLKIGNYLMNNKKIILLEISEKNLKEIIYILNKNIKIRVINNLKGEDFIVQYLDLIFETKKPLFDLNLTKMYILITNEIIYKDKFVMYLYSKIFNHYFFLLKQLKIRYHKSYFYSYFRGIMVFETEDIDYKSFFDFFDDKIKTTKNILHLLDFFDVYCLFKKNTDNITKNIIKNVKYSKQLFPFENLFHIKSLKNFIILKKEVIKEENLEEKLALLLKNDKTVKLNHKINSISELQKNVASDLKRMGKKVEMEKQFDFGNVDLFIDNEMIIEVLGKVHFFEEKIDLNSQFKKIISEKIGYKFFFVSEYDYLKSKNKKEYLFKIINS